MCDFFVCVFGCGQNELFVLVTDQGFLRESNVVWETLSNIEGDGHFVDADFRTYRLPDAAAQPLPTTSFPVNSKEQIDHEYDDEDDCCFLL